MKKWFTKLLGDDGERLAAKFLRKQGYKILAKQYRNRMGEVDLIALDGQCIVFVEVKTRRSTAAGLPVEAVTSAKQQKLTQLALVYLKKHKLLEHSARFDVVSIIWPDDGKEPEITHYRHAFEAVGVGQMYS